MFWMKKRNVFHVQKWKQLEEKDVKIVNIYNLKKNIYVKNEHVRTKKPPRTSVTVYYGIRISIGYMFLTTMNIRSITIAVHIKIFSSLLSFLFP